METTEIKMVNRFGTVLKTVGNFGVGGCTVALIVALAQSGNVCGALAVGIALSAATVYAGSYFVKLAALGLVVGSVEDE